MMPKRLAMLTLALMTLALGCLCLPQPAQALVPGACGASQTFMPVLPIGRAQSYSDALFAIGSNNSYSMPNCEPVSTARKKSALLLVPPVPQAAVKPTILAAVTPKAEVEPVEMVPDLPARMAEVVAVAKPVARPSSMEASIAAPSPAPAPKPAQVQAQLPAEVPDDSEAYSEPFAVTPLVIGVGAAAVLTYALWESLDDEDGTPARLSAGSEPVQALAAYDTRMLASFAALNTVADLQSDQQIAVGVSSSIYDETPALAAGMSLRLGRQGIFKTAISYSENEYMANAGLSYGW
jgi:hypothetical protein